MGAIAAWDGIAVKVERPCYKDASNQNKFWCRKGFPAVSVQAACDADRRFSYFSLEFAGSVHDSRAYRLARTRCGGFICREMADSRTLQMTGDDHPHGFFVLGDDAYPYSNHMCVPWSRVNGKPARDAFNYHQSRGRINVECPPWHARQEVPGARPTHDVRAAARATHCARLDEAAQCAAAHLEPVAP